MLTLHEILFAIVAPAIVAALFAGLGFWRRWAWTMPAAAGIGFLAGYFVNPTLPGFPPQDGTDWLFWAAIPLTALVIVDALIGWRWSWILGAAAGGVALLIARPLVPGTVAVSVMWGYVLLAAACGAAAAFIAQYAESRIGSNAVVAALCITVGAAAITVFSCNLRTVGVYGLAAAAALGPVAIFTRHMRAARSVAILSMGILAGLLVGGRVYPDPGVPLPHFVILVIAPLLVLPFSALPARWKWWRGVAAVLAVAIVAGLVAGPTALKAKKAAEGDPYAGYSQ